MKRALLIFALLLSSLIVFSQSQISFGLATKLQKKVPAAEWPGWSESSAPILIYMDLGFGFLAIENGYHDRFILDIETTSKSYDSPDKTMFTVKAKDQNGNQCTLEFVYFVSGNFSLIIRYTDIHYSYWCDEEHGTEGYPYPYFNATPPTPKQSPKIKSPSTTI